MSGTTKKCPYCAEEINVEAIKYKHCRSDLQQASISSPVSTAYSKPQSKEQKTAAHDLQWRVKPGSEYKGPIVGSVIIILIGIVLIWIASWTSWTFWIGILMVLGGFSMLNYFLDLWWHWQGQGK